VRKLEKRRRQPILGGGERGLQRVTNKRSMSARSFSQNQLNAKSRREPHWGRAKTLLSRFTTGKEKEETKNISEGDAPGDGRKEMHTKESGPQAKTFP